MTLLDHELGAPAPHDPRGRRHRIAVRVWLASFVVLTTGWGVVAAAREYPQHIVDGITAPFAHGPAFSPDGRRILYVQRDMDNRTQLRTVRPDGGEGTVLAGGPNLRFVDTAAVYSPDGRRIAYVADTPTGDEYIPARALYVANADGQDPRRVADLDFHDQNVDPAFSPDGGRLAFTTAGDVWVVGVDGAGLTRLTRTPEGDHSPAYSPDGRRITFVSERDYDAEVYVMNTDGSGQRKLTDNEGQDTDPAFSPDGKRLVYVHTKYGTQFSDVVAMKPDGTGKRRLTPVDGSEDTGPAFSPDGRTIAFVSDRSGEPELWLMDADGTDPRRLTHVSEAVVPE